MPFIPILFAILIAGSAGTAVLADSASPGDALYPIDQWVEKMTEKLTSSETKKAVLNNQLIEERLTELEKLQQTDPTQLEEKARELWEARRDRLIANLKERSEKVQANQEKLQELLDESTNSGKKLGIEKAIDKMDDIDARIQTRIARLEQAEFKFDEEALKKLRELQEEHLKKQAEWRKHIREKLEEAFKDRDPFEDIDKPKFPQPEPLDDNSDDSLDDDDSDDDDKPESDETKEDDNPSAEDLLESQGLHS